MKKIILLFFAFMIAIMGVEAKGIKNNFSGVIKKSGVDTDSIAISIKAASSGKTIYGHNDKILMHPASVQKLLTVPIAAEKLGNDYRFKTSLYSRGENEYLIKLGADPYLTSKELKTLVSSIKPDVKKIYIDDSIVDNKTWGEGWQWDDDMNSLMPRFSAYNLDQNLVKLTIMPPKDSQAATIINPSKYPFIYINNIKTADITKLDIKRDNNISANTLILNGTIARPTTVYIPINNPKRYFEFKLTQALENRKIYLKEPYRTDKLKANDKLETEIEHSLQITIPDILKNSNNMSAEILFKIAGGGTDVGGVELFNQYCEKMRLDNSRIRIVDGSGVSKNNLISADFISEFLIINNKNEIMENLPCPGEGTLTQRLLPIKNNLRAKTGTLSDISSIAGYLTSKKGKKYVFAIMINDMKFSSSDKKMLEDYIIREAYLRL